MSGVRVRLMIPDMPDHPFVYRATQYYAQELITMGAEVYRYDVGFLHSKAVTIDHEIGTVGSANMGTAGYFPEIEELSGRAMVQIVSSGPDNDLKQIKQGFMRMFASARSEITIQTPYFIPDSAVLETLEIVKIAIIDGKIGYIGGLNVGDQYVDRSKKFGHWRDTHLRIHGDAVLSLQSRFLMDWNATAEENELLVAGNQLVDLLTEKAREGVDVHVIFDQFGSHGQHRDMYKRLREAGGVVAPFLMRRFQLLTLRFNFRNHQQLLPIPNSATELANLFLRTDESVLTRGNKIKIFTNGPDKFKDLFEDIRQATHHVHLEYFTIDDDQIFSQQRDIASIWAWLLVLIMLPVLGFIIFFFVGSRISDKRIFRLRTQEQLGLEQIADNQRRQLEAIE
ncbi:hypothetical protein GQS40_07145|uniref:PLD phosphodiesterase domain-containing protein n=1 Tax=Leuconostoc lactis TaxID=1246 RepID=A0A6L7AAZ7_LEULA|nr:hypothetical protein [Leuconostoc lactis]